MGAKNVRRAPSVVIPSPRYHKPKKVSVPPTLTPTLPIILILGPPGSGKGTICKQLSSDFQLQHLSVGDWLRAQTAPPIACVPDHINAYVSQDVAVPEEVLEAEYGTSVMPAPLTLYQCTKRNVSTPESMKCNLMPAMKVEIEALTAKTRSIQWCGGWRDRPKAVLLDNLTSTLAHAEAAAGTFSADFPMLAIAVDCSDETAEARFLASGRGSDDAARFRRRIARFRKGNADVITFLRERGTNIVEVSTEGEPATVYKKLLGALAENRVWNTVVAEDETVEFDAKADVHKQFSKFRSVVFVGS